MSDYKGISRTVAHLQHLLIEEPEFLMFIKWSDYQDIICYETTYAQSIITGVLEKRPLALKHIPFKEQTKENVKIAVSANYKALQYVKRTFITKKLIKIACKENN